MFTGLVEATGEVVSLNRSEEGARLTLLLPEWEQAVQLGESIAVNGCCLTVARMADAKLSFDLLVETLARTNLGALQPGELVNLERALAANARLGGHFVQGHIDCTAEVRALNAEGADYRLEVALPPEFARFAIFKGSIAIDGISLTVAELHEESFVVWLIPHTLQMTNLRSRRVGERVNLEFDLLAKYVERLLAFR